MKKNLFSAKEKTYQSAVVIIPPREVWAPIEEIRKRHDKQQQRWMPHINLLYPFLVRERFQDAAEELAKVCRKISPFELTLSGHDYFKHKGTNYTFWLKPHPREKIAGLHEALRQAIPVCYELGEFTGGYVPHLSVGQAHRRKVFSQIQKRLNELPPIEFSVNCVYMIWRDIPPRDTFQVDREIPLKGKSG